MAKTETAEEKKQTAIQAEPTFLLKKHREHCKKLYGVSSTVFAGATAALDATKEYTVAEIKTAIVEWRKKEVK